VAGSVGVGAGFGPPVIDISGDESRVALSRLDSSEETLISSREGMFARVGLFYELT
jgi:hypothetical protein